MAGWIPIPFHPAPAHHNAFGHRGPGSESLQAALFDFSLAELVRRHRERFPPLWMTESWAKLLIRMALSCSCCADSRWLEAFATALGPVLPSRMGRLFFELELEEANLRLMADPGEPQVLALPLQIAPKKAGHPPPLDPELVGQALDQVGLRPLWLHTTGWRTLEAAVAIPWRSTAGKS